VGIANELITRGWTQGTPKDADGRVCIYGAGVAAAGVEPRSNMLASIELRAADPRIYDALWRAVGESPMSWNDDPRRTFDEVLRVAKEADELLDAS
jgi:hypothetical protein